MDALFVPEPAVVDGFVLEARELLEQFQAGALACSAAPADAESLRSLCRPLHTLKGAAGLVRLTPVAELAHELEALLKGRAGVPGSLPQLSGLLLHAQSLLAQFVSEFETAPASGQFSSALTAAAEAFRRELAQATAALPTGPEPAAGAAGSPSLPATSLLRVEAKRLEGLQELVSQWTDSQAALSRVLGSSLSGEQPVLARHLSDVREASQALQRAVASLRRTSLRRAFHKIDFLTRTLAPRLGKKVQFHGQGEELELDVETAAQLDAVLLHLARNALDHGLESPAERRAAGKAEVGALWLTAQSFEAALIVELRDDGAGLQRSKILAQAVAQGLVAADAVLSEQETFALIFRPGFSTAANTTEISGRGLGLDIVRRTLERLGGTVEVESGAGAGTAFQLYLPQRGGLRTERAARPPLGLAAGLNSTQEQLMLFRRLIDQSSDAILVVDPQSARILDVNEGACRNLGYPREELLALTMPDIEVAYDGFTWQEQVEQLRQGELELIETGRRRKNGQPFPVEVSLKLVTVENRSYIVSAARDITEKKQLEVKYLRAQRMESIGRLAGGIAHDLNNILAPVTLGVQILREKMPGPEASQILNLMEESAQRGTDMIKQILTFARGIKGERIPVHLRDLINEMVKIGRETFPRSIQFKAVVPEGLWVVFGDMTQLHQVLMNLCVNACDAMPEGGVLELRAQNETVDAKLVRGHPGAQAGPHVLLSVRDTGHGIPPHMLEKIFEPFFTTKNFGKGTGLGLATALGIVQGHGGLLTVESQVNKGSCFRIYLPAKPGTDPTPARSKGLAAPRGANELILVVDDEKAIRLVTRAVLTAHGYEVLLANDGAEAVAVFKARQQDIRAVIMDMAMPFMDGPAAIQAIRKLEPAAKILAVSGLMSPEQLATASGQPSLPLLAKPYSPDQLLQALAGVLGRKQTV